MLGIAVAVAAVVSVVLGSGSAVVANHVFPDVDTNSVFHTEVANIAGAGCATGFPDGTFRPKDTTNRQQFAAWMNRCGGRIASLTGSNTTLSTSGAAAITTVGTFTIEAGATGASATGGFVLITGEIRAETSDPAACPCFVQAEVAEEDGTPSVADDIEIGGQAFSAIPVGATDISGKNYTTIPITRVAEIGPDEALTVNVNAFYVDADVSSIVVVPHFSAVYVPFGPDGDDTLVIE